MSRCNEDKNYACPLKDNTNCTCPLDECEVAIKIKEAPVKFGEPDSKESGCVGCIYRNEVDATKGPMDWCDDDTVDYCCANKIIFVEDKETKPEEFPMSTNIIGHDVDVRIVNPDDHLHESPVLQQLLNIFDIGIELLGDADNLKDTCNDYIVDGKSYAPHTDQVVYLIKDVLQNIYIVTDSCITTELPVGEVLAFDIIIQCPICEQNNVYDKGEYALLNDLGHLDCNGCGSEFTLPLEVQDKISPEDFDI